MLEEACLLLLAESSRSLLLIFSPQDGTLNYLVPGKSEEAGPVAKVHGHQGAAQYIDIDQESGEIVTGDLNGRVCVWRPQDEKRTVYAARVLRGEVATKKIAGVATRGGEVAVVAWDDKLRLGETATEELKTTVALPGQPKGVAIASGNPKVKVVVTGSAILVLLAGVAAPVSHAAAYGPTCVDISSDGKLVAVGGKDKKIHLYQCNTATGALTDDGETKEFGAELSVVALNPDGLSVAGGDGLREVRLYSTAVGEKDKAALRVGRWVYHTTRVTGLKWSPNGKNLVSVSTDRRLCVWDPASDAPKLSIDLANPSPFAAVAWADDNHVWTLGTDGVGVRRALPL
jgi:WD repeat-containing protein 1 (actin-interacting protein 1)